MPGIRNGQVNIVLHLPAGLDFFFLIQLLIDLLQFGYTIGRSSESFVNHSLFMNLLGCWAALPGCALVLFYTEQNESCVVNRLLV